MNTSRSTELLRRRFAEPGLSQNATQPTSRRPRYNDDDRHDDDDDDDGHGDRNGDDRCGFQGDDLKPNTWCQKMPRKICAPDNCNMVQVKNIKVSYESII